MASFAYTATHRRSTAACSWPAACSAMSLRPPPEAVAPLSPDLHPTLTTRERVALQTQPRPAWRATASSTRSASRWSISTPSADIRETENDKPIDATGAYQTRAGEDGHSQRTPASWPSSWPAARRRKRRSSSRCSITWSSSRSGPTARSTLDELRHSFAAERVQYPEAGGGDHGGVGSRAEPGTRRR